MSKEFFDAIRTGDLNQVNAMIAADEELLSATDENGLGPFAVAKYSGRNQIAEISPELQIVLTLEHADVVHDLIRVLNGGLRSVGRRTEVHSQLIDRDVRKSIQPWELKTVK